MTTTNGQQQPDTDKLRRFEEMVANVLSMRTDLFRRLIDPRRSIDEECDYPADLSAQFYRDLYDRNAIAERAVNVWPRESWQVTPSVYEDESAKNVTEFEQAWDDLAQSIHAGGESWYQDEQGSLLWSYLLRADILSGIGTYGILLLGIDDGMMLEQPADGVPPDGNPKDITGVSQDIYGGQIPRQSQPFASLSGTDQQYFTTQFAPMQPATKPKKGPRKLLFLRCFDESLVQVVQYEASMYSPRFGQPLMYMVTFNDPKQPHTGVGLPLATMRVHWSRVIHLADNGDTTSEIFAKPRMRPIVNNILDLKLLYGGSAQMYWKGAFPGLSIETNPQLGGDVIIEEDKLKDMMQDYYSGLQRALFLMGMSAKSLSPQVVDPSAQIAAQIEAICIELSIPIRVFKGSERGELASSQDDAAWNDRLKNRQQTYITPRVIAPFIDRLVLLKVLPEPEGYSVEWPDLDSNTDTEKAGIALQETQALVAYVGGNVEAVLPPQDFLTRVLDWDEEEAAQVLKDAEKAAQKKEDEQQQLADEHGMVPQPPPGFQHPPQPPTVPGKPGQPPQQPGQKPPGAPKPGVPTGNVKDALGHGSNKRDEETSWHANAEKTMAAANESMRLVNRIHGRELATAIRPKANSFNDAHRISVEDDVHRLLAGDKKRKVVRVFFDLHTSSTTSFYVNGKHRADVDWTDGKGVHVNTGTDSTKIILKSDSPDVRAAKLRKGLRMKPPAPPAANVFNPEQERDEHGRFAGGEHEEVHAKWGDQDADVEERHGKETDALAEKHDALREKLDAQQTKESEKDEKHSDKVLAPREKEDSKIEKVREKEDTATEKTRDKEDETLGKAREREDKEADKEFAVVEKAYDKSIAGRDREDKQREKAQEKELDPIEKAQEAERERIEDDHDNDRITDSERQEQLSANDTKHEALLEEARARHETENDAVEAKRQQEDTAYEAAEAAHTDRTDARREARDKEDEEITAQREREDTEREAKREAEDEAIAARRGDEDAALEKIDNDRIDRHQAQDDAHQAQRDTEEQDLEQRQTAELHALYHARKAEHPEAHATYYTDKEHEFHTRVSNEFVEEQHPRDEHGRFGSGDGSSGEGEPPAKAKSLVSRLATRLRSAIRGGVAKALDGLDDESKGGVSLIAGGLKGGDPRAVAAGASQVFGSVFACIHQEVFEGALSQSSGIPGAAAVGKIAAGVALKGEQLLMAGVAKAMRAVGLGKKKPTGNEEWPTLNAELTYDSLSAVDRALADVGVEHALEAIQDIYDEVGSDRALPSKTEMRERLIRQLMEDVGEDAGEGEPEVPADPPATENEQSEEALYNQYRKLLGGGE